MFDKRNWSFVHFAILGICMGNIVMGLLPALDGEYGLALYSTLGFACVLAFLATVVGCWYNKYRRERNGLRDSGLLVLRTLARQINGCGRAKMRTLPGDEGGRSSREENQNHDLMTKLWARRRRIELLNVVFNYLRMLYRHLDRDEAEKMLQRFLKEVEYEYIRDVVEELNDDALLLDNSHYPYGNLLYKMVLGGQSWDVAHGASDR